MRKKATFLCFCLFYCIKVNCQVDTNYVLTFDFNDHQIKEVNNKVFIKPVGISLTEDRFGNKKSAIYLHGHSLSYLNLGTSNLLKPRKGSISLWVNLDRRVYTGKGYDCNPIIITKNGPGDDFIIAYLLSYDSYNKRLMALSNKDSTEDVLISDADETVFNKWYHLVLTYDDHSFAFYINGKLQQKSYKGYETKFLETDSVVVGNFASKKNDRWSQGTVDDIQIYHRVLNEKEIKALYEAKNPNHLAIILNNVIKFSLLTLSVIIVSFLFVLNNRRRLKREEEKLALRSKLYEMETKMIKAQMNPHFIFNSLNSIQQFISLRENDKAEFYLANFSVLLRTLLENTTKDYVSLADEIDVLKRYIEMETLRFSHVFKHSIEVDKGINIETTFIPHFLIQPFVENAIWHGLLPKKEEKILSVIFKLVNEKTINCIIDDNGVGRSYKKSNQKHITNKSLAITFIQQRLDLMNKNSGMNLNLQILDKVDAFGNSAGTRVILTLPIIKAPHIN